jgi:hypothetical protein
MGKRKLKKVKKIVKLWNQDKITAIIHRKCDIAYNKYICDDIMIFDKMFKTLDYTETHLISKETKVEFIKISNIDIEKTLKQEG